MAVHTLSRVFRKLNIVFRKESMSLHMSVKSGEHPKKVNPIFIEFDPTLKFLQNHLSHTPSSINFNFNNPINGLPLNKIIKCPLMPNFQIDEPIKSNIGKTDIIPNKTIEIPPTTAIIEKQAVRMIVIRRKKMKKHKRKKFLKRMKFVIRKKEIRKRILKEKIFEADLETMYEEALKFDPQEYVAERLKILSTERLPNRWRGELLPESMIKQFMEERKAKSEYKKKLRTYRLKLD